MRRYIYFRIFYLDLTRFYLKKNIYLFPLFENITKKQTSIFIWKNIFDGRIEKWGT